MKSHHLNISYSQVAAWLHCRHKWRYEYSQELAVRKLRRPMYLGTLVHKYLECALKNEDVKAGVQSVVDPYLNSEVYSEEEKIVYQQMGDYANELGKYAYENLIKHYIPLGPEYVEYTFRLPVSDNTNFVGTIDAIMLDKKTNMPVVLDHKIRQQLQPVENEEINLQMIAYQYALNQLGIEVQGSVSHQVFHKLPAQPKLNKDGSMSRADSRTTWGVYKQGLVANGLNPDDYLEMNDKLKLKEFHRNSIAYRTDEEVNNAWKEIIQPALQQISYQHSHPKGGSIIRSLSIMNCLGCGYRDLCLEDLRGVDTDFLRRTNYTHNDYLNKYSDVEQEV